MGLRLKLNKGDRVVINGCIICNSGSRKMEILIENQADVLRESEMLTEKDAKTPATRLCYMIQIALVSPIERVKIIDDIRHRISQLRHVMHLTQAERMDLILNQVEKGEFYAAMRELGPVIQHEAALLAYSRQRAADAKNEGVAA